MVPFKKHSVATIIGSAWAAAFFLSACSSSNSNQTPPVYGNDAGADATTGNESPDGEAGAAAQNDATTADVSESDAGEEAELSEQDATGDAPSDGAVAPDSPSDAGVDADAAAACASALSDAGCWVCPSASTGSVEFLNQCAGTGVKCVSFDNTTRLPAGYDGGLN